MVILLLYSWLIVQSKDIHTKLVCGVGVENKYYSKLEKESVIMEPPLWMGVRTHQSGNCRFPSSILTKMMTSTDIPYHTSGK